MTILNEEQQQSFEAAARPLIKWMAENLHPHHDVIVCANRALLLEGAAAFKTDEYFID